MAMSSTTATLLARRWESALLVNVDNDTLAPGLFKRVTGLNVKDFELLVSLNVFNSSLMNDAVLKFKRYEDASLVYTGINKHEGEDIGLYDTVLSRGDYEATYIPITYKPLEV